VLVGTVIRVVAVRAVLLIGSVPEDAVAYANKGIDTRKPTAVQAVAYGLLRVRRLSVYIAALQGSTDMPLLCCSCCHTSDLVLYVVQVARLVGHVVKCSIQGC
jgi:hypothetical protein